MAKPRKQRKPRARGNGRTPKEATVLIPLAFNDDTLVPQKTIRSILGEMYAAFHGWTIEGTVKGAYRMRTGQQRVEEHLKVSVVLDASQLPTLEEMVSRWCARLGQEVMLLKVSDSIVKFIPPPGEADTP